MKKCKCKRPTCLHEWWAKGRDDGKKPVQCPRCKSYKWDDDTIFSKTIDLKNFKSAILLDGSGNIVRKL